MPLMNFTCCCTNRQFTRTDKSFSLGYVSNVFVENELKSMKRQKATGSDELPPGLSKDYATLISEPLCHIINLSIKISIVPTVWKIAKITLIFKSGNTTLPENYRPISVLPVLSKILEKSVHRKLMSYLENENLLND